MISANIRSDQVVKDTDPSHGQFNMSGTQHLKQLSSPPNFIPLTQQSDKKDERSHGSYHRTQEYFNKGLKSQRSPYGPTEGSSSLYNLQDAHRQVNNGTLDLSIRDDGTI